MIQKINKAEVKKLEESREKALLTVYVPLGKGVSGYKFNRSQLHNLKSELKKTTAQLPHDPLSLEIESLLREIGHGNDLPGICIFYDGINANVYALQFTPEKIIEISSSYNTGQIQNYFSKNLSYYVLAISKNGSKMYKGDQESLKLMPITGLGRDMKTTLNIDELDTHNLQNHPAGGSSNKSAGLHGHGGYKDIEKSLFDEYLRAVDKLVIESIKDTTAPLVIVSVKYEQSAYKHISKYPNIFAKGVSTNPDDLSPSELHKKTFQLFGDIN